MPKEIIESRWFGRYGTDHSNCPEDSPCTKPSVEGAVIPTDSCVGKQVPLETTYAHIGWSKDQDHVEMAVLNPEVGEDFDDPVRGWFMQLDRVGINRMIRSLRQARDDAFGKDA